MGLKEHGCYCYYYGQPKTESTDYHEVSPRTPGSVEPKVRTSPKKTKSGFKNKDPKPQTGDHCPKSVKPEPKTKRKAPSPPHQSKSAQFAKRRNNPKSHDCMGRTFAHDDFNKTVYNQKPARKKQHDANCDCADCRAAKPIRHKRIILNPPQVKNNDYKSLYSNSTMGQNGRDLDVKRSYHDYGDYHIYRPKVRNPPGNHMYQTNNANSGTNHENFQITYSPYSTEDHTLASAPLYETTGTQAPSSIQLYENNTYHVPCHTRSRHRGIKGYSGSTELWRQ